MDSSDAIETVDIYHAGDPTWHALKCKRRSWICSLAIRRFRSTEHAAASCC